MNCSHNAATCSNEQSCNFLFPHLFMIGMRFLFVMKLSRFMVIEISLGATSNGSPRDFLNCCMLKPKIRASTATPVMRFQACSQSPKNLLQERSGNFSLPSLLKKSSLRPEQILQALLELISLTDCTHFSCP